MEIIESSEIQQATAAEHISSCFKVMQQLRPHLTDEQAFVEQVQRQLGEGYQLVYLKEEEVKAVAGYRILEFLAWGKVLYIDDLITDAGIRKNGHGGKLLTWIIEQAKNSKCDQVHLDSGYQRHDAHRLYLNHGFRIAAHHLVLDFRDF